MMVIAQLMGSTMVIAAYPVAWTYPIGPTAFPPTRRRISSPFTRRTLREALKVCGIFVEVPAMEDLISWLYKQEEATGRGPTGDTHRCKGSQVEIMDDNHG